jgi:tripartite ATP-independent transporter DctP family solute receptor
MTKRIIVFFGLISTLVFGSLSCGKSETKPQASAGTDTRQINIRLAFEVPAVPDNQYNELSIQFKNQIETLSHDSITVEIFGDGQLGTERENFEAVQMGTLEMSTISNASIGAFAPPAIAIDLPGMFPSKEAAYTALDGPAGKAIVDAIENLTGVKGLAFGEAGFRQMITLNKAIHNVNDMIGLKIRVMQNEMYVTTYQSIGANAVPMAYSEVLTALQQRTIDGLDAPLQMIVSGGIHNVGKSVSLTAHFYNALQLIINKRFFDSLTQEQQQIIQTAAKNAGPLQREVLKTKEDDWIGILRNSGVTVTMPNEIDMSGLDAKLTEIYDSYAKQIGGTYVQDLAAAARAK